MANAKPTAYTSSINPFARLVRHSLKTNVKGDRKMKKRLLGFVLCGLIAVSSMSATACLKHKIDDDAGDKSVLYVTNYNGGFGEDWIAEVEKRFETKYEKESFETGKRIHPS